MNDLPDAVRFSPLFDRALAACAVAQELSAHTTDAVAHARATRVSARRVRALAAETRASWVGADHAFSLMRRQVERVATVMRTSGMDRHEAAAAMRAHVRFVLYDGGVREHVAEPLVERASSWVELSFHAA